MQKLEKEQHSGSTLYTIYSLRWVILCKFVNIASSAGINKAITCENDGLPCVCRTIDGSRTLAAFKMELFVTKVNGSKLLLLLQRVPSYMWQGLRYASVKYRSMKKEAILSSPEFGFYWSYLLFHHALNDNHLSFQSCCTD